MAVFISASDESCGKTQRDPFFLGGWVGPEEDWSRFFAPAWQERVLDGPPTIPYLHMTDIRSSQWRFKNGLSRLQAEDRVDEAFNLIDTMATLYPVGVHVNAGHFRDKFASSKVVASTGSKRPFDPDYVCFLGYVLVVVEYVAHEYPAATKIDFIIERKGNITKYIQEFHSQLAICLRALSKPSLAELVGKLIPGGKDSIPLQAADMLCWHTARPHDMMDSTDRRRYGLIAKRKGTRAELTDDEITQIDDALSSGA